MYPVLGRRFASSKTFLSFRRFYSVGMNEEHHDAELLMQTIQIIQSSLQASSPQPVTKDDRCHPSRRTLDIHITGPHSCMLDVYARFCILVGRHLGFSLPGPKPLPRRIQKWSVLSSPFAHKTAFTQFERRTHGRHLRASGGDAELSKRFIWYLEQNCPPDVQMEFHMHDYIPLPQ